MTRYIAQRSVAIVPVLFGISVVVFLMVRLIPGDTVQVLLGTEASAQQAEALRRALGLDRPLPIQFAEWFGHVVRGDLGQSLRSSRAVLPDIVERFGMTAQLTAFSMLIALLVAIPLGVASAAHGRGASGSLARVLALIGLSIPNFWLGTLLILFVSLVLGWLPRTGAVNALRDPWDALQVLLLPSIALGLALSAYLTRMLRSSLLEVLSQDYIRTARGKGLRERGVLYGHALKNSFIPVLTAIGIQVGHLLGGAVIVEEIFSLPGMGRFLLSGIYQRDYPVVQGTVLFIAFVFSLVNLVVDVLYAWLDPRIRY